jgi:dihydrofolate reductase
METVSSKDGTRIAYDRTGRFLVAGSASVVQALTEHRLVDEYRLLVCPLVLGSGQRLFTTYCAPAHFTLAEMKIFDSGALLLRYEAA